MALSGRPVDPRPDGLSKTHKREANINPNVVFSRLEAIATRVEAIAIGLEAIPRIYAWVV